jgi:hypothetical protein
MLLWHGRFGAVDYVVDELFAVGEGLFAAVDVADFFVIWDELVVTALVGINN